MKEIQLGNVPKIYDKVRYADGEIFFADNITSIPNLSQVFKVNFFAFVFCLEGDIHVKLNDNDCYLTANDGLFVDAHAVVGGFTHSQDFRCIICAFSTDLGLSFISKSIFDAAMQIRMNPVIHFTADEVALMVRYYDLAIFKMDHPELNFGRETMTGVLRGYAYDMLSNVNRHIDANPNNILRQGDRLYRRFVLLLADGHITERSVQAYADALCVSPKYLASVCKQRSGRTASEMIALSVVARIKQLLLYSDMTIKEIATTLNFENISFFGKYVKKHLGCSPIHYRQLHGYGK
ncbi:MAG: AraC family transcriptional regulator [Muribaculaceae bacterium]|nr:AraC family transcriptional regulator [Muribaculaceae bacterium]